MKELQYTFEKEDDEQYLIRLEYAILKTIKKNKRSGLTANQIKGLFRNLYNIPESLTESVVTDVVTDLKAEETSKDALVEVHYDNNDVTLICIKDERCLLSVLKEYESDPLVGDFAAFDPPFYKRPKIHAGEHLA